MTKKPVEAEAATKPEQHTLEWEGETLSIPAEADDLPADCFIAFENLTVMKAIRGILGAEQFDRVTKGRTLRDVQPLMEQIMAFYGFDSVGE